MQIKGSPGVRPGGGGLGKFSLTRVTNTKVNVCSVKENGKLLTNGVKQSPNADSNANNKSSASDKAVSKMIPETKKQSSDSNQVVEISD